MSNFEFLGFILTAVGTFFSIWGLLNKRELDRLEKLVARYKAEGKL